MERQPGCRGLRSEPSALFRPQSHCRHSISIITALDLIGSMMSSLSSLTQSCIRRVIPSPTSLPFFSLSRSETLFTSYTTQKMLGDCSSIPARVTARAESQTSIINFVLDHSRSLYTTEYAVGRLFPSSTITLTFSSSTLILIHLSRRSDRYSQLQPQTFCRNTKRQVLPTQRTQLSLSVNLRSNPGQR